MANTDSSHNREYHRCYDEARHSLAMTTDTRSLSIRRLAATADVHRQTVRRWLAGERIAPVSLRRILRGLEALGLDPRALVIATNSPRMA
jgi:hypothetical protein